ncbi:MAG: SH3 domain-containing protein [Alphaproteobacteria bacterium]|nr:SH3 domain-containing protein [Alphaproteobacteria bacterium]MBU1575433.1 SH3 domain-containing protein [Alphaproteobacteria bacterium]MBU2077358.1 SH3 domain-containing protein [Alphaproteobacteria bacterium]MBU2162005.1 SH3 domain-containing protein [Alphaproteobacteria bacterium]MBU2244642.1 SH3 domain-containing protein [Alphaproteobacteria bacterium]
MLRLLAITFVGLWAALMVFGRDLSAEEQAQLDLRRSEKVSVVTSLSETWNDAFGADRKRQGAYVPTLAELQAQKALMPSRLAPETQSDAAQDTMVQLASFSDTPAQTVATATTRVSDPEKLAGLLQPVPMDAPELDLREVTATRVNVRSGPSTRNEVLGQVHFAEIVQVISPVENGWVKISVEGDGVSGYMSANFLRDLAQ